MVVIFCPAAAEMGVVHERTGTPVVYNVVKIKGPEVHLDGNHALAGQAMRFAATVKAVRAATAEEIAHGHVHGAHGHQH